jgi:two-component system response regulator YesN
MNKVIIVDDEELIATNLVRSVPWEDLDCTISGEFRNGKTALDFVRSSGADIVVSDIRMPVMDGIELAKALSELIDPPLVIFLTGYGEFDYAREAIRYGVFDYILKPIDYEELADAVYDACEKLARGRRFGESATTGLLYDLLTGGELLLDPPPRMGACLYVELCAQAPAGGDDVLLRWLQDRKRLRPIIYVLSLEEGRRSLVFLDSKAEDLERAEPFLIDELRTLLPPNTALASGGISSSWRDLPSLRSRALSQLECESNGNGNRHGESTARTDRILDKVDDFIVAHYGECIGVEQIADGVGLSVGYLSLIFKERYGVTILKRLTALRIERAKTLLGDPWLRAHEVANAVGYRDYRHFSQVFKKHVGCTLMEYREWLRGSSSPALRTAGAALSEAALGDGEDDAAMERAETVTSDEEDAPR